jgi:succinate dehydrogenase / fumarate reductase flavoprotein subunit
VFLDIASRRDADYIRKRLPSMYHQFKELADVDITAEPMEVGPTCHYVMGGVEVDPDSGASVVPGLFAAGEVAGGMHGSNRLGGNSLSDLLVFGRRAGLNAAYLAARDRTRRPRIDDDAVRAAAEAALAPFGKASDAAEDRGTENPYTVQKDLQEAMQDLVGIIRKDDELDEASAQLARLTARAEHLAVEGHRQYNPGWHLALDLPNMLLVSRCIAVAARRRTESRGGHTREDYPGTDESWGTVNLVVRLDESGEIGLHEQPLPQMPTDLQPLFEQS